MMQATTWEFKYRALMFGLVIWCGFLLYFVDQQNVVAAFANWMEHRFAVASDPAARLLFVAAAVVVGVAALVRTWASAYLQAQVVYAPTIKTAALVGDGPYRHVRNPLYFANVLLIIGMGAMMSPVGFVAGLILMLIFCYRLIFREESELKAAQTGHYTEYFNAVPRLWPSLRPRVAASGRLANWKDGFKAESWYWGFALALTAYAMTLQLKWFFIVTAVSLGLFWALSAVVERQSKI